MAYRPYFGGFFTGLRLQQRVDGHFGVSVARQDSDMKFAGLLGFLGMPLAAAYAMSVTVTPSTASPVALGSVVRFTASAIGAQDGALTYRFRVRPMEGRTRRGVGPAFRTVVDYGPNAT